MAKNPARKVAKKTPARKVAKKAATKKGARKVTKKAATKKGARKVTKKAARKNPAHYGKGRFTASLPSRRSEIGLVQGGVYHFETKEASKQWAERVNKQAAAAGSTVRAKLGTSKQKNAARKVAKKAATKKGARKVAARSKKLSLLHPSGRALNPLQTKAAKKKRRNGALAQAIAKYEEFHGRGPDVLTEVETLETVDDTVSALGKLVSLEVAAIGGGVVEVKGFKGALLAQDVEGTQLYIVGGDQSVNCEDFGVSGERRYELLGVVESVVYHTTKDHLGDDGGNADYHHEFGENGGKLPALIYDTVDQQLSLVGGDYRLLSVGIDD